MAESLIIEAGRDEKSWSARRPHLLTRHLPRGRTVWFRSFLHLKKHSAAHSVRWTRENKP